jgi:hypothetical protein
VVLGAIILQFRLHGGLEAYPMLITSVLVSGFAWFVAFWFLALRSGEREFIVRSPYCRTLLPVSKGYKQYMDF